jgi:aminoglycoside phosphotransferase (APT) family kinase protein
VADAVDLSRDGLDFDPSQLEAFLARELPQEAGQLTLERISGGQSNPTYFITYGTRRMVLRKKPAGLILQGAHSIEREFRILKSLSVTDVPVPTPLLLVEDSAVLGTPFYLMERVEGRVFSDCALAELTRDQRAPLFSAMAETLAGLHRIRPDEIGLSDYGRPSNYFERQITRWTRQWQQSFSPPIADLDRLVEWLPAHMPRDDGAVSIAHGDFRLGNLMFHPTEPRVVAILDWELSTLGHPLADLGFCCMPWYTAPDEYGGILGLDLEALGIPSEEAFVARYRAKARPTAPLQPFHVIFALFRFAVIFVGIADRARAGNAAGDNAEVIGPLARRFAARAMDLVQRG